MPRPVVVVSRFLPDPAGSAGSRLLHGFLTGARATGRDVTLRSWWPGEPPAAGLPDWVRWDPPPAEPWLRMKARALLRPRGDALAARWDLPADAVALAEEVWSAAVVRRHPRAVTTVHYSTRLDAAALGGRTAAQAQDLRAERSAVRHATLATAYSPRVAAALGRHVQPVPCAMQLPAQVLPLVDAPVVACVADWRWAPNRTALARLLAAWPAVRAAVTGARLLLAGYGDAGVGSGGGVEVLGAVPDSTAVLARAALLVFPCPPTSGPKVKVLEAAALGLPVVTTPAGVEGLRLRDGAAEVVAADAAPDLLAGRVAALLRDPQRRAAMAAAARADVEAAHAPQPAAAARLAVVDAGVA